MEPVPDEDTVQRFVDRRYPGFDGERVRRMPDAGTVNAIFRIGVVAAIRIPLEVGHDTLENLRSEVAAARSFGQVAPVPTPAILAYGAGDDGLGRPWSLQSWVPGEVASPTGCRRSSVLAADVVDLIRTLRAVPTDGRMFSGSGRGGDLRDHDDWMATCFRESVGLLDVPRIRELWRRLRDLPRHGADVMTHGDLIPQNLVLREGRLAGVLDAGGFGPADPALELVVAWHLFDRPRRREIRSGLGSSGLEWSRGAAWALEQAMGLVWYYRETLPAMSALGRTTLTRLVEDPEL